MPLAAARLARRLSSMCERLLLLWLRAAFHDLTEQLKTKRNDVNRCVKLCTAASLHVAKRVAVCLCLPTQNARESEWNLHRSFATRRKGRGSRGTSRRRTPSSAGYERLIGGHEEQMAEEFFAAHIIATYHPSCKSSVTRLHRIVLPIPVRIPVVALHCTALPVGLPSSLTSARVRGITRSMAWSSTTSTRQAGVTALMAWRELHAEARGDDSGTARRSESFPRDAGIMAESTKEATDEGAKVTTVAEGADATAAPPARTRNRC